MKNKFYCGIDVSKLKLDVSILIDEKTVHKVFKNTIDDVQDLMNWLLSKTNSNSLIHVCIEATNIYHELVADFLSENKDNFIVSVVNPRKAKHFSNMLANTKTDKVDAKLLALYCQKFEPEIYNPLSKERRELRELSRLMDNLIELKNIQKVRLHTFHSEVAARGVLSTIKSIEDTIAEIQKEIKSYYNNYSDLNKEFQLLKSIPSFGDRISNVLQVEMPKDENGKYNPKKLTSYFGLAVREWQSGTSVSGKPRITKFGSPRVRNMLYMAALVAISHNLFIAEFYNKLVKKGKPKKVALVAVMRKLLVLACAILNSGKPFDVNHVSYRVIHNVKNNVIYCSDKFTKVS